MHAWLQDEYPEGCKSNPQVCPVVQVSKCQGAMVKMLNADFTRSRCSFAKTLHIVHAMMLSCSATACPHGICSYPYHSKNQCCALVELVTGLPFASFQNFAHCVMDTRADHLHPVLQLAVSLSHDSQHRGCALHPGLLEQRRQRNTGHTQQRVLLEPAHSQQCAFVSTKQSLHLDDTSHGIGLARLHDTSKHRPK